MLRYGHRFSRDIDLSCRTRSTLATRRPTERRSRGHLAGLSGASEFRQAGPGGRRDR
ncbi:hypothetical protein [Cupriavidus sp. USMAA2-4]|uniref:hypothetical protein n=1 Tax=Cupriavidus sp. USMAA2-4 TaxID=876364 RepID=UPI003001756A